MKILQSTGEVSRRKKKNRTEANYLANKLVMFGCRIQKFMFTLTI